MQHDNCTVVGMDDGDDGCHGDDNDKDDGGHGDDNDDEKNE